MFSSVGAAVAFTYTASPSHAEQVVAELTADGATVVALAADSADPAQVTRAVDQTVGDLGGLDILVNNAAVAHVAPIDEFPAEQFDRLVATNIGGVYWAVRSAVRHLGEGGRIINIGSINAERIPAAGFSVYGMTKGAIASFTRGLARDLAPRGITVNNVQPGPIDTDANPADGAFSELGKQIVAQGRYGHTRDVASLVSFLAGPESGYITGAHLNVDGGYTI
ncbi:SDR family oxidoreductase [Mycobacterium sp. pV006]|uniref:SDR family oxidoreductase n=1 Tax=Mycobacterium sp. pV006 TaxID=3238983 RepID=UPI00351AB9BA